MDVIGPRMTRRQLLRYAGIGAAGADAQRRARRARVRRAGVIAAQRAAARAALAHRPDLRIPALTVTRREPGVATDPIFIAPYNAPNAQAGAVIADNSGEPIWENPLAGQVSDELPRAELPRQPRADLVGGRRSNSATASANT